MNRVGRDARRNALVIGSLVCASIASACSGEANRQQDKPLTASQETVKVASGTVASGTVDSVKTQPSQAPPAATSARLAATSANAPKRGGKPANVRCLKPNEISNNLPLQWKLSNKLSVIRVAPDDHLNLRAKPGPRQPQVGQLQHDQRDIVATGAACKVNKTSLWIEVSAAGAKGWANAKFLLPTTKPQDQTAKYKAFASADYPSRDALLAALKKGIEASANDPEVPYRATLVGIRDTPAGTTAVMHQCCHADDAVSGEQVWFRFDTKGGRWRLSSAKEANLCPRGASDTHCN